MSKNFDYSVDLPSEIEKEFKMAELLGEGHNGVVFLLPNNRVIKFFRRYEVWYDESYILKMAQKSRFFPKVYECGKGYIIRDYVGGIRLDKYLKSNSLTEKICEELYLMIRDFEKIKFKRLDLRCKDLFVQDNENIIIIDPKNNYKKTVTYPRHLMKGLSKKQCLDYFLNYIEKRDFRRYVYWDYKINKYLNSLQK